MTYGVNAPLGMVPSQYLNGSLWTGQTLSTFIASGYTTGGNGGGLFTGDPVTPVNTGTISLAAAGDTNVVMGCFQGCLYTDTKGVINYSAYWPNTQATLGGVNATAFVAADPNILFDIQYNATPGLDFAAIYQNANLVAGNGTTQSGQSGWMFGGVNSPHATYQLRVVQLTPVPGNLFNSQGPLVNGVPTFPYNNFLCKINNHFFNSGTGTGGV